MPVERSKNKNLNRSPGQKDPSCMYGVKPKEAESNLETAQRKLAEGKNLNNEERRVTARKKRTDLLANLEPGDNSRFITHDLEILKWGDVDLQNPDQVQDRCYMYFELCVKDDMKPTLAGLSLALGIDRTNLRQYELGHRGNSREVHQIIKAAISLINSQMEHYMTNGKINPVAGIFLMKNNFGYRDQQEVLVKPVIPLENVSDRKQLEERYMDSIVVEPDKIE